MGRHGICSSFVYFCVAVSHRFTELFRIKKKSMLCVHLVEKSSYLRLGVEKVASPGNGAIVLRWK